MEEVEPKVRALSYAEAAAARAQMLAYVNRTEEAQALAEAALKEDANNALAHEVIGFVKFHEGHAEEAGPWYEKAVKLDSHSYLAHYYFAAIAITHGHGDDKDDAQIESSLRTAIRLNPQFAPAYDLLDVYYALRRKNLDEAHMLGVKAVTLDPTNVAYRMNVANTLMASHREDDAVRVLREALKVAKSPEDAHRVESMLHMIEQYQEAMNRNSGEPTLRVMEPEGTTAQEPKETGDTGDGPLPVLRHRTEAAQEGPAGATKVEAKQPTGARRNVIGTIQEVHCKPPAVLEFKLAGKDGTVALHSGNYFKVQFSALGFEPIGQLQPCTDLAGRPARVEFVEVSGGAGQVTAVELRKSGE